MKDHVTDYATAAFRFWAQSGGIEKWSSEKSAELHALASYRTGAEIGFVQHGFSDPTAAAYFWTQHEMTQIETLTQLMDLQAVESTLGCTRRLGNGIHRVRAIERVYFIDIDKPIERGAISERVLAASTWIPASERTIWRWLKDARTIYARERGLRLEKWQTDRLLLLRII